MYLYLQDSGRSSQVAVSTVWLDLDANSRTVIYFVLNDPPFSTLYKG